MISKTSLGPCHWCGNDDESQFYPTSPDYGRGAEICCRKCQFRFSSESPAAKRLSENALARSAANAAAYKRDR